MSEKNIVEFKRQREKKNQINAHLSAHTDTTIFCDGKKKTTKHYRTETLNEKNGQKSKVTAIIHHHTYKLSNVSIHTQHPRKWI